MGLQVRCCQSNASMINYPLNSKIRNTSNTMNLIFQIFLKWMIRLIFWLCWWFCLFFKAQSICHRSTLFFWWGSSHRLCDPWLVPSTQRQSFFPWTKWTRRDKSQLSLSHWFLVLSLYHECLISTIQQQQTPVFILKGSIFQEADISNFQLCL